MRKARDIWRKYKRRKTIEFLKTANPERILNFSEKNLMKAFKKAYRRIPAYNNLIKNLGIDVNTVSSVPDFKNLVPVIDKSTVFDKEPIHNWLLDGSADGIQAAMSSSGFSGNFSFGVDFSSDYNEIADAIDTSLDYLFDISNKPTLFISCIGMGVKIFSSATLVETSVRSDMALASIKKMGSYYEQILVLGDPYFIKKLVEEGNQQNIDWPKYNSSFIFGEDWFPEQFRKYIEHCTGIESAPENHRKVIATMGITELDLNLFQETSYTIAIRKACEQNEALKHDLFGEKCKLTPEIFHYFPNRFYLETIANSLGNNELVFSLLSKTNHMPLIRYNSNDCGDIFTYNTIIEILDNHGLSHLHPDLKLPLVAVHGRADQYVLHEGDSIYPNEVKAVLFEDFTLAPQITGQFRLTTKDNKAGVEIQLNKDIASTANLVNKVKENLFRVLPQTMDIIVHEYSSYPYGMELNYEKKFKFL